MKGNNSTAPGSLWFFRNCRGWRQRAEMPSVHWTPSCLPQKTAHDGETSGVAPLAYLSQAKHHPQDGTRSSLQPSRWVWIDLSDWQTEAQRGEKSCPRSPTKKWQICTGSMFLKGLNSVILWLYHPRQEVRGDEDVPLAVGAKTSICWSYSTRINLKTHSSKLRKAHPSICAPEASMIECSIYHDRSQENVSSPLLCGPVHLQQASLSLGAELGESRAPASPCRTFVLFSSDWGLRCPSARHPWSKGFQWIFPRSSTIPIPSLPPRSQGLTLTLFTSGWFWKSRLHSGQYFCGQGKVDSNAVPSPCL